jgi:dihydropteroate synthase
MGILNVTPDSFSDGGKFITHCSALAQVERMINEGADIIDIGGESTRPGAPDVSAAEELDRVIPLIKKIKSEFDISVSVDTSKSAVMDEAIRAGVDMINDVRALQEEGALQVCANATIPVCLMHMQGTPRSMQKRPHYDNVVSEVSDFFARRIHACVEAGIEKNRLILDPGFGFGKTLEHNLELLSHLDHFLFYNLPLLVGISRKSMIGTLLGDAPVSERLFGSLSAAVIAAMKGAGIIRVHDVKATVEAMKIVDMIQHVTEKQ